jgi:hypothetical protein
MKYTITVSYKLASEYSVSFKIPHEFVWIGGGTDLRTGIKEWQIAGDNGVGAAVESLVRECELYVQEGKLKPGFGVEIVVK